MFRMHSHHDQETRFANRRRTAAAERRACEIALRAREKLVLTDETARPSSLQQPPPPPLSFGEEISLLQNIILATGPNQHTQLLDCYDLNTKFNGRCHADWSETNYISMVTKDGIYILKPHLERAQEPFDIDLIRNLGDQFRHVPFERNNGALEDILTSLNNRQYTGAFLDPALLTNVSKRNSDFYPRRFRSAKWSPALELYPKQCLLTILTVDFQLLIYHQKHGVWVMMENLSRIYDELWEQTILGSSLHDASYDGMRKNLHSLSFGSVCWMRDSYLLASTLTGDIVVWRVKLSATQNNPRIFQNTKVNFQIIYIIKTNQEFISSMQLYENLLITASRNGQVNLFDLSAIIDEIDSRRANVQQVYGDLAAETLTITELPSTAILWHRDNIEVMDFYLQTLTPDTFRIVLTKSTNICWCTIHYKPKTANELAILAISDSFSAINGLDPEVSLHQTPATWLRPAGNGRAVLIADDGSFFQLDFIDNRHDTSPSFSAIRTGKIDLTDMVPKGLCASPSGVLITMISSATFIVDSLKVLAPTKLIVLPTKNERGFFIECMQNLLDEGWLREKGVRSPMDVCDRIDCIRSMIPQLNHYQFDRLHLMLKEEIAQLGFPKSPEQLVILKILSFIILKLEELDNFKLPDDSTDVDFDRDVYDVILLNNINAVLSRTFTENHEMNLIKIDEDQMHVNNMAKFNELLGKYKDVTHESCSICRLDIPFVSHEYGTCANQHQFTRCSRSLLLLDTSKNEVIQCADCKRAYLSHLIWPTSNMWLCMYCQ